MILHCSTVFLLIVILGHSDLPFPCFSIPVSCGSFANFCLVFLFMTLSISILLLLEASLPIYLVISVYHDAYPVHEAPPTEGSREGFDYFHIMDVQLVRASSWVV